MRTELTLTLQCFGTGLCLLIPWLSPSGHAATYGVGPGHPLATPSDVPWESLVAGDTVRIHWRETPYASKWVINVAGTPAAPVVVRGVPGPDGRLPVIDGNGATTRLALDYWSEQRGVIKVGGSSIPQNAQASHIVIENLELRGARPPHGFMDDSGSPQSYPNNGAAIFVESGDHVTIRDCVLHDCGNGLFVAASSSNVVIEGNHLYDNGNVGSIYEHNSYTAAAGITFQYNRYGPLRAGCLGNNLKDRSAGTVIRYNWIEDGNRQLDLVDAEDSLGLQQDPRYRSTFVYGNVLIEPDGAGNRQIIHYGGDSGNLAAYRKGTLHLHHNTIISTRVGRTTLLRLSTNHEPADCRNNILLVTDTGNQLELIADAGRLNLDRNWLKPGWVDSFAAGYTGTVNGGATSITGNDPGYRRFPGLVAGVRVRGLHAPGRHRSHHRCQRCYLDASAPERPYGRPRLPFHLGAGPDPIRTKAPQPGSGWVALWVDPIASARFSHQFVHLRGRPARRLEGHENERGGAWRAAPPVESRH